MTFKIGDKVVMNSLAKTSSGYPDEIEEAKRLQEVGEIVDVNIGLYRNSCCAKFPSIPISLWVLDSWLDLAQSPILAVDPFDIIKDLCG